MLGPVALPVFVSILVPVFRLVPRVVARIFLGFILVIRVVVLFLVVFPVITVSGVISFALILFFLVKTIQAFFSHPVRVTDVHLFFFFDIDSFCRNLSPFVHGDDLFHAGDG